MFRILCLLVLAVIYGASAQTCVPNPVSALQLDVNGTLHWRPSTNCPGTSYIVFIVDSDAEQYYYETDETTFDITHLAACVNHQFIITAIANYVMGEERRLTARTPADPDTQSPTISRFLVTPQSEDSVLLEWDLDPQFAHCVSYFRVVIRDGINTPEDRYPLSRRIVLTNLAPCTEYTFTVTGIYNAAMEGPISLATYSTPAHTAHLPELESVRPGVSYLDMTWNLPSYSSNRCPITQFIVDGSPYVNLTIPIEDSPARPAVRVHVDDLQSDRMYVFRITMVNSGGPTSPLIVGVQTLATAN